MLKNNHKTVQSNRIEDIAKKWIYLTVNLRPLWGQWKLLGVTCVTGCSVLHGFIVVQKKQTFNKMI